MALEITELLQSYTEHITSLYRFYVVDLIATNVLQVFIKIHQKCADITLCQ